MPSKAFLLVLLLSLIAGCTDRKGDDTPKPVLWVKTVGIHANHQSSISLSGTVRARFETPISFQIGGRIASRRADAGQQVAKEQILFEIDPRDLEQSMRATEAERAAAQSAFNISSADTRRNRQLLNEHFISQQSFERTELTEREARNRLDAAQARLQQARHALDYGTLRADSAGVLIEVSGEPGQVVASGQTIAVLAKEGPREVEVSLPDAIKAPTTGVLVLADQTTRPIELREVAGASDPVSRTLRARYQIKGNSDDLQLGSVVRVRLAVALSDSHVIEVPIAALDERGGGPRIWHIVDGKAQPVAAKIVTLDTQTARIVADVPPGSRIIALGTQLLEPGMAVRELGK